MYGDKYYIQYVHKLLLPHKKNIILKILFS